MALRTYGQYCGLAAAMDLVGQRWAMLLVRDLSPGPRRFTDLFEGLPGIATDVLAERLRALEAAGVVRHRTLKHPVPAKVYELTASGEELASIARRSGGLGRPAVARGGVDRRPDPSSLGPAIDGRRLPRRDARRGVRGGRRRRGAVGRGGRARGEGRVRNVGDAIADGAVRCPAVLHDRQGSDQGPHGASRCCRSKDRSSRPRACSRRCP